MYLLTLHATILDSELGVPKLPNIMDEDMMIEYMEDVRIVSTQSNAAVFISVFISHLNVSVLIFVTFTPKKEMNDNLKQCNVKYISHSTSSTEIFINVSNNY